MLLLATLALSSLGALNDPDFARDIQPLFEKHCYACHGDKKQRAGLRFDRKSAALAGSFNGEFQVILPGQGAESELVLRLKNDDSDERMPPESPPLAPAEIELFERWITAGADWPEEGTPGETTEPGLGWTSHWAYTPPRKAALPTSPSLGGEGLELDAIDRFLRARLAEVELSPAPLASRAALLRRASLDLTGLPPSLADLARYEEDGAPGAWDRALERLLASPHYAEHQARHWLDLARYADSQGYEKDDRRTMWRYRDWVIEAFAEDMPFDRFTLEQLAGDLLPKASLEQRVATGFHRNTMVNREGGADPEEFRVAAVKDRVHTTASTWLGTTLECAQCHDHKYDPFSQRDYYAFYAFFNSTEDTGNSDAPSLPAPTRSQLEVEPALKLERASLEELSSRFTPDLQAGFEAWEREWGSSARNWSVVRPQRTLALESRLAVLDDGSVIALGNPPDTETYTVRFRAPVGSWNALRLEVLRDDSLPDGGPGRATHRNFVLNTLTLSHKGQPVALTDANADFDQADRPWLAAHSIDDDPVSGWAIGGALDEAHQLVIGLETPLEIAAVDLEAGELELSLTQSYGDGHLIGRFRVSLSRTPSASYSPIPSPTLLELIRAERNAEETQRVHELYLGHAPELEPLRARLAEIDAALAYPHALVLRQLEEPRESHVLVRGNFLERGEPVGPAGPRILNAVAPRGETPDRLDLAHWLVDGSNPLTARVFVNRTWERLFGNGLVRSSADFGIQGDPPTHPQLLDWLALDFQEQGWSVKELHRTLMRSYAYRQSARVTPEHLERDPDNRYLGRGPRHRVDAEGVRDMALFISGLLDPKVGGPSVFPVQPQGTWTMTYSGDRWMTSDGADRWRRGLYTFWRRTAPYPTFMLFDATSRELACTRRARSNTPLQALALLNDPAFVECAAALARRLVIEGGDSVEERIDTGFLLCTARLPRPEERDLLRALFEDELAAFRRDPDAARSLAIPAGLPLEQSAEGLDPVELAAWTVVANALLNLDETITKG